LKAIRAGGLIRALGFKVEVELMKRCLLLFAALLISVQACFAQEQRKTGNILDEMTLKEFNDAANARQEDLLLKALWYIAPYDRVYHVVVLTQDGMAYTAREVPHAHQASKWGRLSAEQLEEVRRMLANPNLKPGSDPLKFHKGKAHTAFVFFNGDAYARYDYVGSLPSEVQGVLDFVRSEIERQESRRSGEERRKHEGRATPEP
jgi:hypothetical protein